MRLEGKRILVTGGAGFIGSHLVDHLLETSGASEVCVLDNLANGRLDNLVRLGTDHRLRFVQGDVLDAGVVEQACQGVELVFHLACLGVRHSLHSPLDSHRVNAEGSLLCLLASQAVGVSRFVYVSSSEVFGTGRTMPMNEYHPTWPETVYGASKLAGEAYTRALYRTTGFPTVVVRPFNTYGPRSHFEADSGEFLPRSIVRALHGLPPIVFGDGAQTRDFLHVSDTARALAALGTCDAAVGRTINVGYGDERSITELCRLICTIAGCPDLKPEYQEGRPGDVRQLCGDNTLVRELIDFSPRVNLEEGIRDLIAWFKERTLLDPDMLAMIPDRNWQSI